MLVCVCVYVCVCVCVCVCVRACARALRTTSTDKILRFISSLIIMRKKSSLKRWMRLNYRTSIHQIALLLCSNDDDGKRKYDDNHDDNNDED